MNQIDIKVIFLGESSVGKSSIIQQLIEKAFNENIPNTIGTAFTNKEYIINNKKLVLHIWDTCGQERFMAMAKMYYKDANVILLVMDCLSDESFTRA